ncbi:hypothetical protein GCM10025784_26550 [Citricoccus nitrophenolicus]
MAEPAILSDDHSCSVQCLYENLLYKDFRRLGRDVSGVSDNQDSIHTLDFKSSQPVLKRHDGQRSRFWIEQLGGQGIKGYNDGLGSVCFRRIQKPSEKELMSTVDAVEAAQADNRLASLSRYVIQRVPDFH